MPDTQLTDLLLVEDELDAREAIQAILELEGYRVQVASNGQDALQLLRSTATRPKLIILDLLMPVMNGYEFLRVWKSDSQFSEIPVCVMTGVTDYSLSLNLQPYQSSLAGILKKPFDISDLLKIVTSSIQPKSSPGLSDLSAEQQLLEASNDGFWDWNIVTGHVKFSRRWAEMLGYSLDEIEPHVRSWEKLVHPEDLPEVMNILQQHLDGSIEHYETEHRVLTKDGKWKWILDRGRVVERDRQGRPVRAAGAHIDISERKQLEQEKESLLRSREELLGVISHELKNPLNAMTASTDLIRRFMESLLNSVGSSVSSIDEEKRSRAEPAIAKAFDTIQNSSRRMIRLISDLLDTTKLEAGTLSIVEGKVQLESVLSSVRNALEEKLRSKKITIVPEIAPDLPVIKGDKDRIEQVLLNLLDNAIKFSPEAGSIHLSVRQLVRDGKNWIQIGVQDEGPGIEAGDLPKVFDRFWQAKGSAYRGTGLGLHISQGIARSHGGLIKVESASDKGARFDFLLPL